MQSSSNHPRKTIGVLIDWTVDPFQQMFLDGVLDFAKSAEMSCIIFEGGSLNSPYEDEAQRNAVIHLADRGDSLSASGTDQWRGISQRLEGGCRLLGSADSRRGGCRGSHVVPPAVP